MTSIGVRTRQVSSDSGYYIPLATLVDRLYSLPATAGGPLSTATWARGAGIAAPDRVLGLISSAGAGLLKDMGKTVVSSTRVFRKVQLVVPSSVGTTNTSTLNTFGVGGAAGTTAPQSDFYTAYIELASEGGGNPTPVALFGR
jgi:hypothetical protein